MLRSALPSVLFVLAACGGGGGGGGTPTTAPARLVATDVDIAPGASSAEVLVQLADGPGAPALLEVAVELPSALTLPASDRLVAATSLHDLDGDFADGRFVVLCGDARNPVASQLPRGPLFRLRIVPTNPRQVGTHVLQLRSLRVVESDGRAVQSEANPVVVNVTIR